MELPGAELTARLATVAALANHFFTIRGAESRAGVIDMDQPSQGQVERRRAGRAALHLSATMRDGARKAPARVIDMSTHGCRIECSTAVADDSFVLLGIAGLEAKRSRVAWHCEEFIGLEFETPLSDAVFERLLQDGQQLTAVEIKDLRNIASRTNWLARKADVEHIANLADISRQCAENAVIEGLRLKAPKRP